MRHIVMDTETTGFNAETDDRIVEIGAVELINYVPTGRVYHQYINPERPIPAEVVAVHGIDDARVANEPVFAEIVADFEAFIGEDTLVIHNAEFDMRFINAEFKRVGLPPLPMSRALDTLMVARKMFPGAPASLDALCKRFEIDSSERVYHGALLDSYLLADVFLQLMGGHQPELLGGGRRNGQTDDQAEQAPLKQWPARIFPIADTEAQAHNAMLESISNPIWLKE